MSSRDSFTLSRLAQLEQLLDLGGALHQTSSISHLGRLPREHSNQLLDLGDACVRVLRRVEIPHLIDLAFIGEMNARVLVSTLGRAVRDLVA